MNRPTRMDRLVISDILGPFIGSVFLFTSLILASGELIRFAEYLQSGESVLLVAQLIAFTLPSILSLTFPIAMLLATLLGVGRLSSDSEIVALIAAGISFERIMLPIGVFGLMVSLLGVWFTNSIVPAANAGRQSIIDNVAKHGGFSVAQEAFSRTIRKGNNDPIIQLHAEGGIVLGERTIGAATLHNVSIELWQNGSLQSVIYADRADWVIGSENWTLDGNVHGADFTQTENSSGSLFGAERVQTKQWALGKPDELQALKDERVEDVSTKALRKRSKLARQSGYKADANEAEVEVARRTALPFASFVFALVGAPLGIRPPRSGKGVGFGYAVGITFLYWSLLQLCTVIGHGGTIPPWVAMMLPNLLGIGVGMFLIRRLSRGF